MTAILTDSMARDHVETIHADAAAARRARLARQARRDVRRGERRQHRVENHPAAATVVHAVGRPLAAARHWLVAGQL